MDENKKDMFVCMGIGLFSGFLFLSTAFVGLVFCPLLFKKMGLLEEEF